MATTTDDRKDAAEDLRIQYVYDLDHIISQIQKHASANGDNLGYIELYRCKPELMDTIYAIALFAKLSKSGTKNDIKELFKKIRHYNKLYQLCTFNDDGELYMALGQITKPKITAEVSHLLVSHGVMDVSAFSKITTLTCEERGDVYCSGNVPDVDILILDCESTLAVECEIAGKAREIVANSIEIPKHALTSDKLEVLRTSIHNLEKCSEQIQALPNLRVLKFSEFDEKHAVCYPSVKKIEIDSEVNEEYLSEFLAVNPQIEEVYRE